MWVFLCSLCTNINATHIAFRFGIQQREVSYYYYFVWYSLDELSINLTLRGDPVDTAMSSTKEYNTAEEGITFESGLIEFDTL